MRSNPLPSRLNSGWHEFMLEKLRLRSTSFAALDRAEQSDLLDEFQIAASELANRDDLRRPVIGGRS